jgi:hypothetical protein
MGFAAGLVALRASRRHASGRPPGARRREAHCRESAATPPEGVLQGAEERYTKLPLAQWLADDRATCFLRKEWFDAYVAILTPPHLKNRSARVDFDS